MNKLKVKYKAISAAALVVLIMILLFVYINFLRGPGYQKNSKWESEDGKFIIYVDENYNCYTTIKSDNEVINGYCTFNEKESIIIEINYSFSVRAERKILERWYIVDSNLTEFSAKVDYSNYYNIEDEITFKRVGWVDSEDIPEPDK